MIGIDTIAYSIDSVIVSSLREIKESKNSVLVNFSLNFCETSRNEKIIKENTVALHKLHMK